MKRTRTRDFQKALGAKVRYARVAARISQFSLGEVLGVTFQQVQKYENGTNSITVETLLLIAETVGKPYTDFIDGGEAPTAVPIAVMRDDAKFASSFARITDPALRRRLLALIDVMAVGDQSCPAPALAA